ncbi:DUF2180 family protein [Methanobacterium sp.]|uniref:DUF2180 family protein n=1 Tax=Methanobacterium sp. TaxID=2164 RepID=UPI0025DC39F8|nr:DUF2180 family protein [Methanobacterium sp.]MBI5458322.1 DUF2180 family protein [Methanobacterium sp.]MDY9922549.1 DUF2180 family protein [Methanobacterium sp.]
MKCYICAEEGKSTDAVAICIVCGMGLCMDHAIRQETEVWSGGYPFPAEKLKETLPRILCKYCYQALKKEAPKGG